MRAAGHWRVVIRRHMLLPPARNQCMTGSINGWALKTHLESPSLDNEGCDHANTPSRINQRPRTACACMREGRGAGIAIPLQCLSGTEWEASERAQHGRGDAARSGRRGDDPAGNAGPGRSRSDDRDGRAHRRSFRRAALTEGFAQGLERRQIQGGGVAVQRDMKSGTNPRSCGPIAMTVTASRSSSLCPSPFRAG